VPSTPALCPTDLGLFAGTSFYDNASQFGSIDLRWQPEQRWTARVGYRLTHIDGDTLFLNPLMTFGTLRSNFHQPSASVVYAMGSGISWRAQWGYYGYGESAAAGPTLPRNFHANSGLIGLRYSF